MSRLRLLSAATLFLPAVALAEVAPVFERDCAHEAPHDLQLDLDGVRRLRVEVGPHNVHLQAGADGRGAVEARACASSEADLERLRIVQERDGDRLTLRAEREDGGARRALRLFGSGYAFLELRASVPADLPIEMTVGSGDGLVAGAPSLDIAVGSGDARVEDVAGRVDAVVGSGELEAFRIGSLDLGAVGSGDATVRGIRGDARIGSVGSGDAALRDVAGSVEIGSVGSGDVALRGIGGDVNVGNIGSGDLDVEDVAGDLRVRNVGSGDVDHRDVRGELHLPRRR